MSRAKDATAGASRSAASRADDRLTVIERSVAIAAPPEAVFAFHDDPRNLARIMPPGVRVELLDVRGSGVGRRVTLRMTQFLLLRRVIVVEFVRHEPPRELDDTQVEGPFAVWRQYREMIPTTGGTELRDRVEYRLPFGPLGRLVDLLLVRRRVERMFAWRQRVTRRLLEGRSGNGEG